MAVDGTLFSVISLPPLVPKSTSKPKFFVVERNPKPFHLHHTWSAQLYTRSLLRKSSSHFTPKASSSSEEIVEPATNVKFQSSLNLPGCSTLLALVGTGHRNKVLVPVVNAIVYAVGFYVNRSVIENLNAWKTQSEAAIQGPQEKSLQIVLVMDISRKNFLDDLYGDISARIKAPTSADKSALSMFRSTFKKRSLKKGTSIFLTWVDTSKMLVSISSDGLPSKVGATIESENINLALFDVFLGDASVSPTLTASVSKSLSLALG